MLTFCLKSAFADEVLSPKGSRDGEGRKRTMKKHEGAPIDPSFVPVVAAFANDHHVVRKRMFSSDNVLTVQGKIFAMFVKGKLVAKLPRERVDELVRGGIGTHFDPGHGRLMKEWVAVGPGGAPWVALAREAYRLSAIACPRQGVCAGRSGGRIGSRAYWFTP